MSQQHPFDFLDVLREDHDILAHEAFFEGRKTAWTVALSVMFAKTRLVLTEDHIREAIASWKVFDSTGADSATTELNRLFAEGLMADILVAVWKDCPGDAKRLKLMVPSPDSRRDRAEQPPDDAITLAVACQDYAVSRRQLLRGIESGQIESYRPVDAAPNSPHMVSRKAVAARYPKRSAMTK